MVVLLKPEVVAEKYLAVCLTQVPHFQDPTKHEEYLICSGEKEDMIKVYPLVVVAVVAYLVLLAGPSLDGVGQRVYAF
jgi:hypothetical protein